MCVYVFLCAAEARRDDDAAGSACILSRFVLSCDVCLSFFCCDDARPRNEVTEPVSAFWHDVYASIYIYIYIGKYVNLEGL